MEKKSSSQLVFSLQKWLYGDSGKKLGIISVVIRSAQVVAIRLSHGYYWVWKRKDENPVCNLSEPFNLLVADITPSSGIAKELNNLFYIVYNGTAVARGPILAVSTSNIPEVLRVIELTYVRDIQTCLTGYSDCLGHKGANEAIYLVCSNNINIQYRSMQIKEVSMI